VITFQPPTADFYFSPAKPQPGEEVTFDASDSFDFDGQVVSYAWDFDADGETDAEKPIVKRSFPKSGSYQVTLTITDNDGNTDSITYTIEVH
jgi:PKD repeat protein